MSVDDEVVPCEMLVKTCEMTKGEEMNETEEEDVEIPSFLKL